MSSQVDYCDVSEYRCKGLEDVLRKKFGSDLMLIDYSVGNLVSMGDNFGSKIMKVDAKIQRSNSHPIETLHMVLKTVLEVTYEMNWTMVLEKETFMYTDGITLYERIEKEYGLKSKTNIGKIIPVLYGHRKNFHGNTEIADEDSMLLMENLKAQGYYIENKKIGLDLEHSKSTLKSLAKFHAYGIAAKIHNYSEFDIVKLQSNRVGYGTNEFEIAYDNIITLFNTNPQLKPYAARMQAIRNRRKEVFNLEQLCHEKWTTIVHCDLWTNNILFKKNEFDEIENVRFIDFQGYRFADVFVDLTYFLNTSINEETTTSTNFDVLIDVYYDELISILSDLKIDLQDFGRENFDEIFKRDSSDEFLRSVLALNFFYSDYVIGESFNDYIMKLISFKDCSEIFFNRLMNLLRIYEMRDWLG